MGYFDAFALVGKHNGVIAYDIPRTDGFETNRLAIPGPGLTLATIDRAFIEISAQVSAMTWPIFKAVPGCIDLMPMMSFDHFDIDAITEHGGGGAQ